MFVHYLVKPDKYYCCQFKWHISRETSEFIFQDMRPP